MDLKEEQGRAQRMLSPTARRLIRSYGVIVLLALAFLLLALFVREKEETVPAQSIAATRTSVIERIVKVT
jgi:hypothetical protein